MKRSGSCQSFTLARISSSEPDELLDGIPAATKKPLAGLRLEGLRAGTKQA